MVRLPAPNHLDEAWHATQGKPQPPALQQWHEVVIVSGSLGSYCVLDRKLYSQWIDPRRIVDIVS